MNPISETEVLSELQALGFSVDSVSDLFAKKMDYRRIIPRLVEWLPNAGDESLREELVRALTVRWARPAAARELVRLFPLVDDPSGMGIRWAIANALAVVADDSISEELISLVGNSQFGRSREMLAVALGNLEDDRVDEVLMRLLDDEELVGHALIAIRKRKVKKAAGRVAALLSHPKKWVRDEAKKALESLKKA